MASAKDAQFREDLYYRLAAFEITLPPLRERGRDVIAIAKSILAGMEGTGVEHMTLPRAAQRLLLAYDWPGNIRELQNVIKKVAILSPGKAISPRVLADHLGIEVAPPANSKDIRQTILELARGRGRVTEPQVRSTLGTSRHANHRVLKDLLSAGDFERRGHGPATYYRLATRSDGLSARQRLALDRVDKTGAITRREYQSMTGVSERTARRELAELLERGKLETRGQGRSMIYVRAKLMMG